MAKKAKDHFADCVGENGAHDKQAPKENREQHDKQADKQADGGNEGE